MGHDQVDAHVFVSNWKCSDCDFARENAVPLLPFPFHRQRLDLALHRSMHLYLDRPDQASMECALVLLAALRPKISELPACMIGIGKRAVLVAAFEPGIAGVLSFFDPIKEAIIGPFDPHDHVLQHMRSNVTILWSEVFHVHQITLLSVVIHGEFTGELLAGLLVVVPWMPLDVHLIGVTTFGERCIVEFPGTIKNPLQFLCCRFIGRKAILKCFDAHFAALWRGNEIGSSSLFLLVFLHTTQLFWLNVPVPITVPCVLHIHTRLGSQMFSFYRRGVGPALPLDVS